MGPIGERYQSLISLHLSVTKQERLRRRTMDCTSVFSREDWNPPGAPVGIQLISSGSEMKPSDGSVPRAVRQQRNRFTFPFMDLLCWRWLQASRGRSAESLRCAAAHV